MTTLIRAAAAVALVAGLVRPAEAQVATRKTVTLEGARIAISAAGAEARRLGVGGVFAVVDEGGNLVALERIDNTFAAGAAISIGKARTAVQFKRPTRVFEEIIRNGRTPMIALEDFTPLQGGIPIIVEGEVVGGIGVSGASSAQQDEEFAIIGAEALVSRPMGAGIGTAPEVGYWTSAQVADAFKRGAVLYDGTGRNYMIHASRRDQAGLAEVHDRETDIIYVLGGSATLVTGGTVRDLKVTAPGERRGPAIDGGTTRTLAAGDVIVVPAGTPHWFRQVAAPFTYYVVKVQ